MTHWSESYIGIPYEPTRADCGSLLGRVRREVFNLPVPSNIEIERSASRLKRQAVLTDLVDAYGLRTDNPVEGDGVLMICRGRSGHIGVYCEVNGEKCVLHAMENAGSVVLHKLRDLEKVFLKVEGFYSWK